MSEALDDEINITPEKLPALYAHACNVYRAMFNAAGKRADGKVVYTGFLSRLMKEPPLGLSTPMYTHVTQILRKMNCIVQVRRGGGGTPSIWQLIAEPTEEKFLKVTQGIQSPSGPTFSGGKYEELISRISDLDRTVGSFDDFMRKTADALIQQGTTIQGLQEDIRTMQTKSKEKGETLALDI